MNHRPDALGPNPYRPFPLRLGVLFLFFVILPVVSGCQKKPSSLTAESIHAVTHEFVLAARNASQARAQVEVRPELRQSQPGKGEVLVYDHVYVTVPLASLGAPDRPSEAIQAALARVAERNHLQRVDRPGGPGLDRFDYFQAGRLTQSFHLITPFPKAEGVSVASGRPRLAIVLDDLGNDRAQADALFRLAYPLTVSILPHEPDSSEIAEEAHLRGYQVMLHLPVASQAGDKDEPVELYPGMDPSAVEHTLADMLSTVPYASGVNNHEGSLGTADLHLMDELMPFLRERHLFFIDSRTTTATVAESAAHAAGIPAASRNVFLDDDLSAAAIRRQFNLAMRLAREKRSALVIGHPHPETLRVLKEMLPLAQRGGMRLVFASDLAR